MPVSASDARPDAGTGQTTPVSPPRPATVAIVSSPAELSLRRPDEAKRPRRSSYVKTQSGGSGHSPRSHARSCSPDSSSGVPPLIGPPCGSAAVTRTRERSTK